jgi:hypothetical protein
MIRWIRFPLILVVGGAIAGCDSPPSVTPLLRLSREAITAEMQHLQDDAAVQRTLIEQRQLALADAFEADLGAADQEGALNADWVREATQVYVLARETLVKQQQSREQTYAQRIDNLDAAAQAQDRAIAVLERQDELVQRVWGMSPWRVSPAAPPAAP